MLDHAFDFLKSTCRGLTRWIFQSVSAGRRPFVLAFSSRDTAEEGGARSDSSPDMDIIDIVDDSDSSWSDDDDNDNDDDVQIRQESSFSSHPYRPQTSRTGHGSSSTQRRVLPSSFQPSPSRPPLPLKPQQQDAQKGKFPPFSSQDKLGRNKDVRNFEVHHDNRRDLPLSSTRGGGGVDGAGTPLHSSARNEKLIIGNVLKVSNDTKDDVHMYRNAGTHRVLPPSMMSGAYASTSRISGSVDAGNRSGLVEERPIEHDETPIYQEALQTLAQPKLEDDLSEGILSVTLLKHQKIALAWMVQREMSLHCSGGILADDQGLGKTISMIALIQKQRTMQTKFTSDGSCQKKSEALNLDEDDDEITEIDKECGSGDVKRKQVASTSIRTSSKWKPAAGTLVVCPASILRQWAHELDEKVTDTAKLSVLMYHGGMRTRDPIDLAKYDVVLTTYTIVTNEVPKQAVVDDDDGEQRDLDKYGISSQFSTNRKRKKTSERTNGKKKGKRQKDSGLEHDSGPLARVRWFRIILDEAQNIKNHRTQVARACSGLRARSRWCLSGTPIQNSIDDLYSYFRFLKYYPYAVYASFCNSLKYPISRDAKQGYKKLSTLLRIILLRRTKGTLIDGVPVVKLPPKTVVLKKIDFSPEERSFYLKLEADSRQRFKAYAAAGTVKQNYANILLMLLRLRQACDHPILVKGCRPDTVGKDSLKMARQLPRDMLVNLLSQLEASTAICRICNDPPEDAVVTMCCHVFCFQCVSERLTGDENVCPAAGCKDILETESVFSRATLKSCLSDELYDNNASASVVAYDEESSVVHSSYVSSKIKAVLEILNSLCKVKDCCQFDTCLRVCTCSRISPNPEIPIPAKAIVFSQWTTMLDLLEFSLNSSLIQYRRLDGTMSLNSRDKAVQDFNSDPEVTVILMSLKAGNLGLNMVAACHVILLDLWWNPTTEDQAVDRAHRIGQTRPVTVSRLTIKDTVEDRILALQVKHHPMNVNCSIFM
ncbi:helicase-like transcription factor CHR28 isoform X3 [Iris pallida]|uniref:Helicase-like transcription factor CHR28 isoform X3 n=1 Tax=Iris pallida TaxID=29817 RepID=A0AAX6IFU6_IRIPA|nr:helicase-like transcription factor CHR28 isoform X3 [Iris pallida]